MPRWSCRHYRTSPLAGTDFSDLATWRSYALAAALESGGLFPRQLILIELQQRRQKCPGCRVQDRRARRAWTLLAVAACLLLLVRWRCG